jgi:hypothetical protein
MEIPEMERKNRFATDVLYTWPQSRLQNRSVKGGGPGLFGRPTQFPLLIYEEDKKKNRMLSKVKFPQG